MSDHEHGKPGEGIGARVPRKEDARHLHGRGSYVSDMLLPGQMEVAFLRRRSRTAASGRSPSRRGRESAVFVSEDLAGVKPMSAGSTLPTYKVSEQHPLARGKVRFVGEPVAMTRRADAGREAEDLAEQIELDVEELPPLIDSHATRVDDERPCARGVGRQPLPDAATTRTASRSMRATRPSWSTREVDALAPGDGADGRQGGGRVLGRPRRPAHRLHLDAGAAPHPRRPRADASGSTRARCASIAPDVGGGFGYKCMLQPEEVCVAWLALQATASRSATSRTAASTWSPARTRASITTSSRPTPTRRAACSRSTPTITIDGGAYSNWPFTVGLEPGQATGNLPGPYDFRGYRVKTYCVATNKPGFLPYRGVARTGVCFAMELLIDAIAREVGREPWEVRMREPRADRERCRTTTSRASTSTAATTRAACDCARETIGFDDWRERQRDGEPDGRLIGVGFATYCEQSAHGTSRVRGLGLAASCRATTRPRCASRRTAGSRSASACIRTARAWRPRSAQIAQRGARHRRRADPGGARRHRHDAVLDRHLCVAQHRDGGRRGGERLHASCCRASSTSARI